MTVLCVFADQHHEPCPNMWVFNLWYFLEEKWGNEKRKKRQNKKQKKQKCLPSYRNFFQQFQELFFYNFYNIVAVRNFVGVKELISTPAQAASICKFILYICKRTEWHYKRSKLTACWRHQQCCTHTKQKRTLHYNIHTNICTVKHICM